MGTHHSGNGGDMPPDGEHPPDPELPELPPEWGQLAIPDDLSSLADEAEQVRAELADAQRTARPLDPPDLSDPPEPPTNAAAPTVRTPLLIMSVAVLITLISLFAMAWSGASTVARNGAPSGPTELPPLHLTDPLGQQVALTTQLPMVMLLVEDCDCQQLIAASIAAAPAGVRVVTVGHSPPAAPTNLAPRDPLPLRLADPTGLVRTELRLTDPTDAATVVLVDRDGRITRVVPAASSLAQFQGDLTSLSR